MPVSNFVKVYPHSGENFTLPTPETFLSSHRLGKKKHEFQDDHTAYYEVGHYLVKTGETFPFDMDSTYLESKKLLQESLTDSYTPHTDRVLRPEIVSCFSK